MKQINGIGSSAVMEAQLARTDRNSSAPVAEMQLLVTKSPVGDTAHFSATSLLIQQNGGAEDVRHEKVASIKAAIDAGTYGVPAYAVADKLMESMFG